MASGDMEFRGNAEEKIEDRDSIKMEGDVEAFEGFHGIIIAFLSRKRRREEKGDL